MAIQKEYIVSCYFQDDGMNLQQMVETYFQVYFKEELEKMRNAHEE